ncbi:MAG: hypothetical protein WKG07_06925 [Hymenobacter sp.]
MLALVNQLAGPGHVEITSAFIGTQPSSYPTNTIYLWTSGPQEAVLKVNLNPAAGLRCPPSRSGCGRPCAGPCPRPPSPSSPATWWARC